MAVAPKASTAKQLRSPQWDIRFASLLMRGDQVPATSDRPGAMAPYCPVLARLR